MIFFYLDEKLGILCPGGHELGMRAPLTKGSGDLDLDVFTPTDLQGPFHPAGDAVLHPRRRLGKVGDMDYGPPGSLIHHLDLARLIITAEDGAGLPDDEFRRPELDEDPVDPLQSHLGAEPSPFPGPADISVIEQLAHLSSRIFD